MKWLRKEKFMRVILLLMLTLTCFLWTGPAFAGEAKALVTGNTVNIRSVPSVEAEIVAKVSQGDQLTITGQDGQWYKIKLAGGKEGWIAGWLVEVQQQQTTSSGGNQEAVRVKVDGKQVTFDVEPYIDAQDRTMVPIRFVANELGSKVFWKEQEKEVTITGNGKIVQLWIGQTAAKVNGQEVVMDTVPVLQDERTMVPLRFVADSLGVKVAWESASNTVLITTVVPSSPNQNGNVSSPPAQTGTTAKIAIVTGSVVNIRSGPGLNYELVSQVKKGEYLDVVDQSGDWYQVQTPNGSKGWLANWLVMLRTASSQSSRSTEPGERPRPAVPVYTGQNKVLDVTAQELEDGLQIVLTGEHPLNYSLMTLQEPRRLVVDLFNTILELDWESEILAVADNELVSSVRVGQFTEDQARVVIDLKKVISSGASLSEDGKQLILKLQPASIKGKTIVIDPGHASIQPGGWSDPGAVGPSKLYEKDVILDIALKLSDLLTKEGATVILTRTGDTVLTLVERAAVANDINADIFVSVHANSSPSPSLAGTATYYYAPGGTQLGAQGYSRQRLAAAVQAELVQKLQRRDIGILEENFSVLRNTVVPSILVETAFISNYEEEKFLADPEFRTKAAEGIAQGIIRYFTEQ